jgi:hypothetical protein
MRGTENKHKEIKCLGEEGAAPILIVDPHLERLLPPYARSVFVSGATLLPKPLAWRAPSWSDLS